MVLHTGVVNPNIDQSNNKIKQVEIQTWLFCTLSQVSICI